MAADLSTQVLPLELIDKAIGSKIWVLMRGSKEVTGKLLGFDDYVRLLEEKIHTFTSSSVVRACVAHTCFLLLLALLGTPRKQVNLVLEDAVEYSPDPNEKGKVIKKALNAEILLNGNQIAVLVPGGSGPSDDLISSSA